MTMTRQNFLKLLTEGLREVFFMNYREQKLIYPQIFDVKKSRKRAETDESVVSIGMLQEKNEGVTLSYEDFIMGYETNYVHTSYAKGIRLTRELLDDELYSVMNKRVAALGRSARYRKEYDHALIFNNATATTTFTGGDGVALLSASHPRADGGGNQVNYQSATALSLTSLETAFTAFREMQDDKGMLVHMEPKTLLVPAELEFDAYEILQSKGKPYTADNEDNFFKGRLNVVVWPFLTDENRWFILGDKMDGAPISFDRVPVEFDRDDDFNTKDLLVSAYTRYSAGFSDWRWVHGGN